MVLKKKEAKSIKLSHANSSIPLTKEREREILLTFQFYSTNACVTAHIILRFAQVFTNVRSFNIKNVNACVVVFGCDLVFFTAADLSLILIPGNIKRWGSRNFTLKSNFSAFECLYWSWLPAKYRRFWEEEVEEEEDKKKVPLKKN